MEDPYNRLKEMYKDKTLPDIKVVKIFTARSTLYLVDDMFDTYHFGIRSIIKYLKKGFIELQIGERNV